MRRLASVLLLACLPGLVCAQQYLHINVNAVGGTNQVVPVGAPLPEPFVARVTDDAGMPLAGVKLAFEVNACFEFPEMPPGSPGCQDPALYGRFTGSDYVSTVTDQNGEATASTFIAGELAGNYSVFVSYFPWDQTFRGYTLTDIPHTGSIEFQITQIDAGQGNTVSTPALTLPGVLLLCAAFALLGAVTSRRHALRANP